MSQQFIATPILRQILRGFRCGAGTKLPWVRCLSSTSGPSDHDDGGNKTTGKRPGNAKQQRPQDQQQGDGTGTDPDSSPSPPLDGPKGDFSDKPDDWKAVYRDPRQFMKPGEYIRDLYDAYDPREASENPADYSFHSACYKHPKFFLWSEGDKIVTQRLKNTIGDELTRYRKGDFQGVDHRIFPSHTDVVIIGGGIMGTSIAHWLGQRNPHNLKVTVVERDSSYSRCSTVLSVGGIRQQFSLPENIEMSLYSAEFLRNARRHLNILDHEPPQVDFHPHGYLLLASEDSAEQLLDNHRLQTELGAYIDVLTADRLQERFPWLNTAGLPGDDADGSSSGGRGGTKQVVLGAHGVQNEGWFDPWNLLCSMKAKAEWNGVHYLNAEVIDFNLYTPLNRGAEDQYGETQQQAQHLIVRLPDGREKQITFAVGVIAAGAFSGQISEWLRIGDPTTRSIRRIPCPIEPRKRYVYVFHCPDGPGLDMPMLVDPSGVYCRREGLGGHYICGLSPGKEDEPEITNLDVDYSFFEDRIWPVLARRVKAFENLKVTGAWAGFYDYNYWDENPIIGQHPYYKNILWAAGFSGHGIQMAPAVGRGIMELIMDDGQFRTIDLSRLGWERIIQGLRYKETNIF